MKELGHSGVAVDIKPIMGQQQMVRNIGNRLPDHWSHAHGRVAVLDKFLSHGPDGSLRAVRDADLPQDVLYVFLDRLDADLE